MSETRWVRHISGQGEKWKVLTEEPRHWRIMDIDIYMWLPKSEYILCEPPTRWVDVTEDCVTFANKTQIDYVTPTGPEAFHTTVCCGRNDFRLRKVQLHDVKSDLEMRGQEYRYKTVWAFIVEKKEST